MNTRRFILYTLLLLCACYNVSGQYYKQYTTSDGLISNYVYQVSIDRKGYVWLCTDKGVTRFNGRTFESYSTANGLTDNEVYNCYEDLQGRIWFYTFNGIFCYYKNGTFYNKHNDSFTSQLKEHSFINTIYEDGKDSTLYIGHIKGPIQKIKGKTITAIPVALSLNSSIRTINPVNDTLKITAFFEDYALTGNITYNRKRHKHQDSYYYNDRLIITSDKGLSLYDNGTLIWQTKDAATRHINILHCYYDGRGNILCGTRKGLIIYNIHSNSKKIFLENMRVTSSRMDADNNYWVSTFDHGVFYFSQANLEDITTIKNIKGYDITRTSSEQVFLKKQGCIEVLTSHESTPVFEKLRFSIPENCEPVLYDRNTLYYHNKTGGGRTYSVNNNTGERKTIYADFFKAYKVNDTLYVLFNSEVVRKGILKAGILNQCTDFDFGCRIGSQRYIRELNCVYLIAGKNILYRYNVYSSAVEIIDTIVNAGSSNHIFHEGGRVFLLGNNGTLSIYDTSGGALSEQIKLDHIIYEVIKLSEGKYIINTDKGYSILHIDQNRFRIRPIQYPFYENDILFISKINNQLVCCAGDKVYGLQPGILNKYTSKPRLHIDGIMVNSRLLKNDIAHVEASGKTQVTIFLNAVYFGNNPLTYRYRIREDDDPAGNWIYVSSEELSFSFASQGYYTIEIQAGSYDIYTPGKVITFRVKPPFLKSNIFLFICIVALGVITFFISHYIHKKRKRAFSNEMNFLKLEHKATNALLNPHFIFNAINNIQNLVNQNSSALASEYLATLSIMIRQNIDNLQFNLIPLEKELQLVKNYVALQNLRFGNNIHFHLLNEAKEDCHIPPLLIQTFVENAIVHGYDKQQEDFKIDVVIHTTVDDYLAIEITDNGTGIRHTKNNRGIHKKISLGISFTDKRLKRLSAFCRKDYTLQVADLSDSDEAASGTRATIIIYSRLKEMVEKEKTLEIEG